MKNIHFLMPPHLSPHNEIDFDQNAHEAKKWGRDFSLKQEMKMNRDDHRAFNIFSRNWSQINHFLRQEKGALIFNPAILEEKGYDPKWNDMIKNFDKTLEKLSIGHTLHVYRRVDGSFFGLDQSLRDNSTINVDLVQQIKNQYENKMLPEHSYMSTSLSKNAVGSYFSAETMPILMKIKILPHIKGIYISEMSDHPEELELLVKRGYKLKYEKFAIIQERTSQVLQIAVSIHE